MNKKFQDIARRAAGAKEIFKIEDIQTLWSGYGMIMRYGFKGGDRNSVVIKHVKLEDQNVHPRGWNTDRCRIPHCLGLESSADEFLMVLEDLDDSGFPVRKDSASMREIQVCLQWLANFHAAFMGEIPVGLWPVGTYWHLETRPDELEDCQHYEVALLNFYFARLREALANRKSTLDSEALEEDWRGLYPVAWTDFHRFMKGWSPGHWQIHGYSERLARDVVAQLKDGIAVDHSTEFNKCKGKK